MKSKVVYVASDSASIFTLVVGGSEVVHLKKHGPHHPSEPAGKHQTKKNDDVEHFMHEVAQALGTEDAKILLVGPAQAKHRLKAHLDREHTRIAKNIVGVETIDKSTEPQIVAFAREFFTRQGVYEAL